MMTPESGDMFPGVANTTHVAGCLTLRDYFAAAALQGLLAGPDDSAPRASTLLAQWSYDIANAMLAERDK